MIRRLTLAIGLLLALGAAPLHAQGIPILNGTPTFVVPDYNIEITIQALQSPVGGSVYLLEKHADGGWYGFYNTPAVNPITDWQSRIDLAGGPVTWINLNVVHNADLALATRFPPINAPPPSSGIQGVDTLNTSLFQSFAFTLNPDGTVHIGIKQ